MSDTATVPALQEHVHGPLKHQFDDIAQQHEADTLGMWLFLATEVMFFGGMFTGIRSTGPNITKPSPPPAIIWIF